MTSPREATPDLGPDDPAEPAEVEQLVAAPTAPEERPWPGPRITLRPNTPTYAVHQLLVDGHDISRAAHRAVLLLEPGCWPRLDLELRLYEKGGGLDADGAEIVLPPETVAALRVLGWTPPGPPARPDSARS